MKREITNFPLSVQVSFEKLFNNYKSQLNSKNDLLKERANRVLKIAKKHPILTTGIKTEKELYDLMPQIDIVMEDLFSTMLGKNEIKVASFPFHQSFFKSTQRYKDIIADAGDNYILEFMDFSTDEFYKMGCSIILGSYYGYEVDFKRPFLYNIPDSRGITRSYRVLYNADYITIEKSKNTKDISAEDVDRLLENYGNIEVWKELFPPESWIFKGFVIANMFDVTVDSSRIWNII